MNIRWLLSASCLPLLLGAAPAMAHDPAGLSPATSREPAMTVLSPDKLAWQDAPPILPRGARMAVLKGDPAREGMFILRLRAPDGYRIMPHWHPAAENVTVLSGRFHLGSGEAFDKKQGTAIGAGGFVSMPAMMRHFAWFEGESEIQLTGQGPWQLYYVDPRHDPRTGTSAK